MDLGAFCQIDNFIKILDDNGIVIPRMRGIRLMSEEKPITDEEIDREAKTIGLLNCEEACESYFVYHPVSYEISNRTRYLRYKYITYDGNHPMQIKWDKIHGKKRKLFKYLVKNARNRVQMNFRVFNKYCGCKNILCIHARIGGNNWKNYRDGINDQPWFIEKVDDPFDSTYCDIYVRTGIALKDNKTEE